MASADEAISLSEVATRFAELGQFESAIENYQAALTQQSGDHAVIYEQLSQCYSEIDLYHEAYEAALMAHSTAPQWPAALLTLARCSLNVGLLPEADQRFADYVAHQPDDFEAQTEWAELMQLQQKQLALRIGLPGLQIEQLHGAQGGPGNVVWKAGIALSQYFVAHPELVRGQRILELGSGTGIVGITLARLRAQVTLTDTPGILPLLQRNINHNLHGISAASGSAVAAALDWNDLDVPEYLLRAPFYGIVGSDLIYSEKDIEPLTNIMQQLKQHSTLAFVTIAHKNRSQTVTDQFLKALRHVGCALQEVWSDGAQSIHSTYTLLTVCD